MICSKLLYERLVFAGYLEALYQLSPKVTAFQCELVPNLIILYRRPLCHYKKIQFNQNMFCEHKDLFEQLCVRLIDVDTSS